MQEMSTMHENREQIIVKRLVQCAVLLGFLVIILGAFTRLVDAGLGCPDWPGCYGHLLWPNSADEIQQANKMWPDAQVEKDKTWPEMVHRYLASGLGLLSIMLVLLSVRFRQKITISLTLPIVILCVIILQGMFGMWTVTLKLWPQVVTAHLLGGFTTVALFWLLLLYLSEPPETLAKPQKESLKRLLPWLVIALVVVYLQIALGGWTTSNYAVVACPDLPKCQDQWWPMMDFSTGFNLLQTIGPNYLGGLLNNESRIAIHMMHRIGALCTLFVLLFVGIRILRLGIISISSKVFAVFAVLTLQIVLGVSNILFNFPLQVAIAHNAIGALLLLKVISLLYAAYYSSRGV